MYISVLSRLFLGCAAPPIVQMYPPISVSEAAAPPIRMMACIQSQSVFNSIYHQTVHTDASTQQWYAVQLFQNATFYYEPI